MALAFCLLLAALPQHSLAHGLAVWAEVLDDGRTVRVEAYYSDGKPVVGASVEITLDGERDRGPVAEGQTDDDGRFEAGIPEPANLRIEVRAGRGHHRGEARLAAEDFGPEDGSGSATRLSGQGSNG